MVPSVALSTERVRFLAQIELPISTNLLLHGCEILATTKKSAGECCVIPDKLLHAFTKVCVLHDQLEDLHIERMRR